MLTSSLGDGYMFFVTVHKTSRKNVLAVPFLFSCCRANKKTHFISTISSIYKIAQNIRKCNKFCTKFIIIIITVNINIVVKQVNSLFY